MAFCGSSPGLMLRCSGRNDASVIPSILQAASSRQSRFARQRERSLSAPLRMEQADQNVVPGPTAPSARYEGVPEGAVSLSPEEARKLDARLAKVRDAYFRRLPESDPEYDEMQELLKKAQDLAANATYAPGACTEDNNRRNAKRSRDA